MNQQVLFGFVCCAILALFFLLRGRKNDPVSWLVLLFGIVAIFVIIANWSTIAQWWPAITAAAHAAPVSTPAPLHAATQGTPVAVQPTGVSGTQAAPNTPLASLMLALVVPVFLAAVAVLIVTLAFVRRNQWRRPPILHRRSVCRECHQEGQMRQYRYQQGRTRILGNLCQQCARRLDATLA